MSERDMLPADVAELLTVVVEALSIPLPSIAEADEQEHYRLLDERASEVRCCLWALLRHPYTGAMRHTAGDIRRSLRNNPVTYTPFTSGQTDGEA
ncbi:hypothetical protein [Streptomyces sp. NPDC008122]|uniref:hypothetical protein n=1 Tax=Streptomyces sp. NPDC008122 TaxID=3364810 RepID=UPI0036E9D48A